jgi:signal transduction histidine kinase
MEIQKGQVYEPPAVEVMTALTDLAALSRHAGSSVFATPGMHYKGIATALLERLLALCGAERGAILITTHFHAGTQLPTVAGLSNKRVFHTCTLHNMNEEEVFALLSAFSIEKGDIQEPPQAPSWMLWRLPIFLPSLFQQDATIAQENTEIPHSAISSSLPYSAYTTQVFFFFGCDKTNALQHPTVLEKGQAILPLVADAVSSVIISLLLTERVQELEVSKNRKALREMELLKAELLATVSHELRSPLASIKGYAATLLRHERRISREERHEFLIAIKDASDRLEVIINRLLEMSQLETGTISIERTKVDIVHLVREAIIAVEQRFGEPERTESTHDPQNRVTFTLCLEDSAKNATTYEPLIEADRHRLREVLDNLLENAAIYSPEGGIVEVGIRPVSMSGTDLAFLMRYQGKRDGGRSTRPSSAQDTPPMIEIWVRDHGIGIPSKHLERIFERFHRVDTRLIREVNGLGLGLAICKRIVELHDGMIWAESTPGEGSIFHVFLPIYERSASIV